MNLMATVNGYNKMKKIMKQMLQIFQKCMKKLIIKKNNFINYQNIKNKNLIIKYCDL